MIVSKKTFSEIICLQKNGCFGALKNKHTAWNRGKQEFKSSINKRPINMINKWLIFLVLMVSVQIAFSQKMKQVNIALTSEAIGLPFTNYLPYHPGLEISGTLKRKEKEKSIRYLNVKAGFFHHKRLETAIYLGG